MAKLTDTQLIVLSKAAARGDGAATVPENINRAAAAKVGSSLIAREFLCEIQAHPGMPIWHEDAEGQSISLVLTAAGRAAIGIEDEAIDAAAALSPKPDVPAMQDSGDDYAGRNGDARQMHGEPVSDSRSGSKQELIIQMLSKDEGTTLDALVVATGWLPHSTRAALTGLRKRGFVVERHRGDGDKASVYRIIAGAKIAAE